MTVAAYDILFTDQNANREFVIQPYTTNGPSTPTGGVDPSASTANTTLFLYGKGAPNYGDRLQEDMVYMLEHFYGSSEPSFPIPGQIWFNNSVSPAQLFVYNPQKYTVVSNTSNVIVIQSTNGLDTASEVYARFNNLGLTKAFTIYSPTFVPYVFTQSLSPVLIGNSGGVSTVTITTQPSGTLTTGTYTDVNLTTVSGTGSGAIATVVVSGGIITAVTITSTGIDYAVGDTLDIPSASITGATSNGVVTVATVSGTVQLTVTPAPALATNAMVGFFTGGWEDVFQGNIVNVLRQPINANNLTIENLATPVNSGDAANKSYVDTAVSGGTLELANLGDVQFATPGNPQTNSVLYFSPTLNKWTDLVVSSLPFVPLGGGTMTGPLYLSGSPTTSAQAATKSYVDTQPLSSQTVLITSPAQGNLLMYSATATQWINRTPLQAGLLPLAGGTMTGPITFQGVTGTTVTGLPYPTQPSDAASMQWVEDTLSVQEYGIGSGSFVNGVLYFFNSTIAPNPPVGQAFTIDIGADFSTNPTTATAVSYVPIDPPVAPNVTFSEAALSDYFVTTPNSVQDPTNLQLSAVLDTIDTQLGRYSIPRGRLVMQGDGTSTLFDLNLGVPNQLFLTLGTITPGSGYTDGTYTNVPLTGGSGFGAVATITVSGGAVTLVTLTNTGRGYKVGDVLSASNTYLGGAGSGFSEPVTVAGTEPGLSYVVGTGGLGVYINGIKQVASERAFYRMTNISTTTTVTGVTLGAIATLGTITGGSGYTNGTYTAVPLTGSATGTGAQATVIVSGGAVTTVTITNPGSGYLNGDTLTALATNIGGTGTGFSVVVTTASNALAIPGNYTAVLRAGVAFVISGTTTVNDGSYVVVSASYNSGSSSTVVITTPAILETTPGTTAFVVSGTGTFTYGPFDIMPSMPTGYTYGGVSNPVTLDVQVNGFIGNTLSLDTATTNCDTFGLMADSVNKLAAEYYINPIVGVTSGALGDFVVSGDRTTQFPASTSFAVRYSASNSGTFTVSSAGPTYSGTNNTTTIPVNETITSSTVDGIIFQDQWGYTMKIENGTIVFYSNIAGSTSTIEPVSGTLLTGITGSVWPITISSAFTGVINSFALSTWSYAEIGLNGYSSPLIEFTTAPNTSDTIEFIIEHDFMFSQTNFMAGAITAD